MGEEHYGDDYLEIFKGVYGVIPKMRIGGVHSNTGRVRVDPL